MANLTGSRVQIRLMDNLGLSQLPDNREALATIAKSRANALLADHRRVREAADARGNYQVTSSLPVDVMGVYVLVPGPSATR